VRTERIELGRIITPAQVRRAGDRDYAVLSMTMRNGLVNQADKFKKRIASADTAQYKVVERNQLVVGFPIDEGVLAFQNLYDEAIVSPAYNIWNLHDGVSVDTKYLELFLRSPGALAFYASRLRSTTARRRSLPNDIFLSLLVPVPPLAEQERLVKLLDEADALRKLRAQADRRTAALIPALFHDMFGDPANSHNPWPAVTIGDVCEVKGGKRLPKGDEYADEPTPYRYVRISDIHEGWIEESGLRFLKPETQRQISRYTVREGDLVITIAGTIGVVAPVGASLSGANLTENAAKLVPRDEGKYDTVFLSELMRTSFVQDQIGLRTGQVTIGKLALFRIEQISFPLPPLSLQQQFARRVTEIRALEAAQAASRLRLEALFQSMLHRAFNGEL